MALIGLVNDTCVIMYYSMAWPGDYYVCDNVVWHGLTLWIICVGYCTIAGLGMVSNMCVIMYYGMVWHGR